MTSVDVLDPILSRLDELRTRCPELRFGQLISTIGILGEDETGLSLWDIEDIDFAAALERFSVDMARRKSEKTEELTAPDRDGVNRTPTSTALPPPRQVS
ncbi:MAG TPA: hypothetical protein VHR66_18695 [Gemmataceae bacterium]|jgi:hypothetical protein|nr:hypothetical protein [Gemmataceae bacterium]